MKKGFTLIELLAVILILGIIALIAIPTVNKIINEARYGAFKSGNDNIMKTIEQDCQTSLMKGENPALSYIFTEGKSNIKINVKGALPTDGYILLNRNCSITDYYLTVNKNVYSNGDDIRRDYMLKAPSEEGSSIFKTLYSDYYGNIKNVSFINDLNIPENGVEVKNVSVSENGKIKSWLIPNGDKYDLYVGSDKTIYLNYDSKNLFKDLVLVENINFTNINTSFAKYMNSMFSDCTSLVFLDLNDWNTSNVENMRTMFSSNNNLKDLYISNWNTGNVTNMSHMFKNCWNLLKLDVSNWDVSNVTDIVCIFNECKKLQELDLSKWDTSNVTSMLGMFSLCSNLKTIKGIEKLNVSKATSLYCFFNGCSKLQELDLSKWDTTNVTDMSYMFNYTLSLKKLYINNFKINNVTTMQNMFFECQGLETIDLSNWDFSNVTNFTNIFHGCFNLSNINLKDYTSANILDDYLPDRVSLSKGKVIIKGKTSGIEKNTLSSKNWDIYDINNNLL